MNAQRGFTLLETTISIGLTSACVVAVAGAVANAARARAALEARESLANDALNVLSDLRAATAYDGAALARLGGRGYAASFTRDGATFAVTVDVRREGTGGPLVASVTVADRAGASATESEPLAVEAPAPGSSVDAATPSPAP